MDRVRLGFKAFDPHELLPHALAERLGYYRDAGLEVSLQDTTFLSDDHFTGRLFTPACGSVLLSALRGSPQKVLQVSTDRPMFWICSETIRHVQDLKGVRLASFPFFAPPHTFLRVILRQAGIDPDQDIRIVPVRDDFARLRLLRRGDVDAIVMSSCRAIGAADATADLHRLFFGDSLRVVSSGLATSHALMEEEPDLVERMTAALGRALVALHEQPGEAVAAIASLIDGDAGLSRATYLELRDHFARTGQGTRKRARESIHLLAGELGIQDPPGVDAIYASAALAR